MSLDEAFARAVGEKEASILRPVASQLAAASREYGFLEVYFYPSVDAMLATAILVNVLRSFGVDFVATATPVAPKTPEGPALFLGYPVSAAFSLNPRRPSALIGYGEVPQGILPVTVAALPDSSVAGLTAGVLSELTVVGRVAVYSIPAAIWRRLDRGKKGELVGIEVSIVEVLSLENQVETRFSLRLARWNQLPTEKAIPLTWLPYLPGLTGRQDRALELLRADERLERLIGKNIDEAPEDAVAVLGEKLYRLLRDRSRVPRRPTEIIGLNYYSPSSPLPDLREAAAAIACVASESYERVIGLGVNERLVAASIHYEYRRMLQKTVDYIEEAIGLRPQTLRAGKLHGVVLPEPPPCLLLVEHELRRLGVVPPDSAALFKAGDGYAVSMETVLDLAGYEYTVEAIDKGCIEYSGGGIGVVYPAKC